MKKVVRLGTSHTHRGRWYSIYAEITIEDGKLSIHGVEGPTSGGNAIGSCGQIGIEPPQIERLAPEWTREMLVKFREVWRRWHLNDLRAECEHQRALGWTYEERHDSRTYQGEPCPVCGYHIGSAWLKEELPQEVIDFLESLPETDREPAWV